MEKRELKKQGAVYDAYGNLITEDVVIETVTRDDGSQDVTVHVPQIIVKIAEPNA